ncbi:glutaredoxin domain-containing protein [Westerdykella ornata]|uniref:Glutaredoxin domain-containing protein n=1 Tax=Westerdykella ornata TaxID=318751 RepID=A0A6A6JQS2_WESOR|nr:glutaredoxin domain-containing protein [Westerdykella ornata]KAF2277309.1 glutaredoxin domain-containing protein [Westerdykella ornata]
MPKSRMRLFVLAAFLVVAVIVYVKRGAEETLSSEYYTRTQEALQAKEYAEAAKERDAANIGERLKAAEEAAKKAADDKSQRYLESVEGTTEDDKSVAGRVKLTQQGGDKKLGVAKQGGRTREKDASELEHETLEDHEVEVELNAILKKSPVIIFSKSYCPYSKRAKQLLLETYKISPAPFVVELDHHPLGAKLQDTLAESTHRRTVPNILIMGRSIGGSDDIAALHEAGKLEETIRTMGGSRITEVKVAAGNDAEKKSEPAALR